MSEIFWQAKIWGLLHDPALKALHNNSGRGKEGAWQSLQCMNGWVSPKDNSALETDQFSRKWLNHVGLCDLISSASDRAAVGRLPISINYDTNGIQIRHLLSGEPQTLKLGQWHDYLMGLGSDRANWLNQIETSLIPDFIKQETDSRKVYWWLWRCYPEALSKALDRDNNTLNEPRLPLLPAETRLPDGSLWSHATMTSALAGSLAGYHKEAAAYPKKRQCFIESRPYVATFSFTPVQELIKASRKMRDFWAGSWLLHYLSAKVCWDIAWKYGPDTLLYPCLYEQPLIDLWLLEKYDDFDEWINPAKDERRLLTAGFPNVLVMILPDNGADSNTSLKNPVTAAMQQAKQSLSDEWKRLGDLLLEDLQKGKGDKPWMPNLNLHTWDGWLKAQWQTYWVALPIGDRKQVLHHSPRQETAYDEWLQNQNNFACPKDHLFLEQEEDFLKATYELALKEDLQESSTTRYKPKQPNLNVGSWWASIFDQTRLSLNAVKNVRTWQLPTAFGPRSTISGIGPVVHPIYDLTKPDWATEGETANSWSEDNHKGLFDGIEEVNATEVLKRGLHRILPRVLFPNSFSNNSSPTQLETKKFEWYYPDLSSGVAGWLRQMEREGNQEVIANYQQVCNEICDEFPWANQSKDPAAKQHWGIPWVATHHQDWLNPRLLNAGWLIEYFKLNPNQPFTIDQKREKTQEEQKRLREFITKHFPSGNNPTDWYVIAAGDGDGMSEWLKGKHLETYNHYIPDTLKPKINQLSESLPKLFEDFLQVQKRMGPATHSALSRALLDFSNQLVPYLTEERYAGRLIYGGGDDVLAYTNLWEWDTWLWDIRQCFRGQEDPKNEFEAEGDYWHWNQQNRPESIAERPLFTMGNKATISFGITIAHQSVPLAITLENLWEAEKEAKEHKYNSGCSLKNQKNCYTKKDAVQVRVLYGNGNILKATTKFDVFQLWQQLINTQTEENSAIFEQAASIWSQHPAPISTAIQPWTKAFCSRREMFKGDEEARGQFQQQLANFLEDLWQTTLENNRDREIQNWLKLAAFVIRKRTIKLGGQG